MVWSRHLFFIQKNKKKLSTNYIIELFHFIDWVKKRIHIWKIENYMALGPSNKLPNNYMAFCPSYNLPNNRTKIRPRSTDLKTLNLEARLQNGKVLDTYSAQTEFGLLDSCDQCTLYAWYERYVAHMKKKKKTKSHKFTYECIILFVKQNSDLLLW